MSKNYKVVIHYEGAMGYEVNANSEEEAKDIAEKLMMNESDENIISGVCWDICDCWEV